MMSATWLQESAGQTCRRAFWRFGLREGVGFRDPSGSSVFVPQSTERGLVDGRMAKEEDSEAHSASPGKC